MTEPTDVWVLFRTDGEGAEDEVAVVICGTVYMRSSADAWCESGEAKGAIRVPLGGLAEGETL